MMIRESIDELLNAPEGEHYQFKEWKNKDSLREAVRMCCALANNGGGKLVLGVADKRPRRVVGTTAFPQPERTRVDIMSKLKIRVDFYLLEHEEQRVLVFDVASRPLGILIQVDGIAWHYNADTLEPVPEETRRLVYAESGHDFSADICPDVTIADLDANAVENFRKIWAENGGNKRITTLSVEQLLRDSGALTDEGVTYAALILFGKRDRLRKYLPHAEVVFEYRAKEPAGPAAQREEFPEGFFNCFDRIWELVNLRNDNQHYLERLQKLPVPTFNESVVREALLNAAGHRDYQRAGSIFVRQYRNRIIFESPGGFPHGITVENILDRQLPRNKLIADIFKLCGLIERSGQGMNLIYEQAIREAKPLPDFTGSDDWFIKLTLQGEVYSEQMLAYMKKLSDGKISAITKDDYNLIVSFYTGKGIDDLHVSQFDHLIKLGLARRTEIGVELISTGITLLYGNDGYPTEIESIANQPPTDRQSTEKNKNQEIAMFPINHPSTANQPSIDQRSPFSDDWKSLSIEERKRAIIDYLKQHSQVTTSQLTEMSGLSLTRIRVLMQELVEDGKIVKNGNYRYATYSLTDL